jgi:mannose-6-phosphate isomerase-like protein (cupin superfamily)
MSIQIERGAIDSAEAAESRLKQMGFSCFTGPLPVRTMEETHWHEVDVVLAAVAGSFQLKDGSTGEILTVEAGDWTLTPSGTLHAFAAEAPSTVTVGFSEDIAPGELVPHPASELPGS